MIDEGRIGKLTFAEMRALNIGDELTRRIREALVSEGYAVKRGSRYLLTRYL